MRQIKLYVTIPFLFIVHAFAQLPQDTARPNLCSDLTVSRVGILSTGNIECINYVKDQVARFQLTNDKNTLEIKYKRMWWGNYEMKILDYISPFISANIDRETKINNYGLNCFYVALDAWNEVFGENFASPETIYSVLARNNVKRKITPSFGDMGVIFYKGYENQSIIDQDIVDLVHAYTYLFNGYVITKNGIDAEIQIMKENDLINFYKKFLNNSPTEIFYFQKLSTSFNHLNTELTRLLEFRKQFSIMIKESKICLDSEGELSSEMTNNMVSLQVEFDIYSLNLFKSDPDLWYKNLSLTLEIMGLISTMKNIAVPGGYYWGKHGLSGLDSTSESAWLLYMRRIVSPYVVNNN